MSGLVDRPVPPPPPPAVFETAVDCAALAFFRTLSPAPCTDSVAGAGLAPLSLLSERDKRMTRSKPSSINVAIAHTAEKANDYFDLVGSERGGDASGTTSQLDCFLSDINSPTRSPSPKY